MILWNKSFRLLLKKRNGDSLNLHWKLAILYNHVCMLRKGCFEVFLKPDQLYLFWLKPDLSDTYALLEMFILD